MKKEKKTYRIPMTWECSGYVEVEAKNEEEAYKLAPDFDLPDQRETEYVEDSFVPSLDLEDYISLNKAKAFEKRI